MNQPENSIAELQIQYEFLLPLDKYTSSASNQEDMNDVPLKDGIDELGQSKNCPRKSR